MQRLINTRLMSDPGNSARHFPFATWHPLKTNPVGLNRSNSSSTELRILAAAGESEQNGTGLHRILADLKFEKDRADDDRSIHVPSFSSPFPCCCSSSAENLPPLLQFLSCALPYNGAPQKRAVFFPRLILLYDNCNVFARDRV